ncbi:hypothetical protein JL721_12700 [Aureococcus anophagefferens]|nr:hypothetical protein JL721_12700 [Aureococcus anophagefferens]
MRLHLLVVAACAGAFPTYVSREKDGAEAVPPKPAYYAHKDRSSRDRFAAVAAGAAPKNFTTLEALAYAQFRSPICHSVAHALGRRVYAEARGAFATPADRLDAALAACEYRCTGGCLHGAVAAYAVATPATVDIPQTCARASMRRILPFGECAHAAGHALALTLSEVAAFAACEAQRRDPSVAHYCAGGVIMELGDGFFGGARRGRPRGPPGRPGPATTASARRRCGTGTSPRCVDLAIGVAASLELRMDLMDVVLELSRTWLAGDRLGERFYAAGAAARKVVAPRGAILTRRAARTPRAHRGSSRTSAAPGRLLEDEDEDVGFATPRASAPGSPVLTPPRVPGALVQDGAAAADLKKMWDSFVRQLNYYGFHKRTRADEYAITDDPKITSPRKLALSAAASLISRAKDRLSISDL